MSHEFDGSMPVNSVADAATAWLQAMESSLGSDMADVEFDMSQNVQREFQIEITPELEALLQTVGLDVSHANDSGFLTLQQAEAAQEYFHHQALLAKIAWHNRADQMVQNANRGVIGDFSVSDMIRSAHIYTETEANVKDMAPVCAVVESLAEVEWLLDDRSAHVQYGRVASPQDAVQTVVSSIANAPEHVVDAEQKHALLRAAQRRYANLFTPQTTERIQSLLETESIAPEPQPGLHTLEADETRVTTVTVDMLSYEIASVCQDHPDWSRFVYWFVQYATTVIGGAPAFITQPTKSVLESLAVDIGVPAEAFTLAMSAVELA